MIFSIAVVLMFSDHLINTRCVTLTITGHFIELMVNGKIGQILSTSGKLIKSGRLDEGGCKCIQNISEVRILNIFDFEIL